MDGGRGWVTTSDGVRLAVERLAPAAATDTTCVVVHGFAGSRTQDEVRAVCDALVEDGFRTYVFDLRGHGDSSGLCTLGDREEHDVAAVVELAAADSERIVIVGASMGAVASLRYTASNGDVAGVVAVSSPAEWRFPLTPRGWFSTALTRTSPGRKFLRRQGIRVAKKWTAPEAPIELMERIEAPVAFVHGHADRWIHPRASLKLHRLARDDRRRLDLVADMGHAFDPTGIPAIRAAVAWILKPAEHTHPATRTQGV